MTSNIHVPKISVTILAVVFLATMGGWAQSQRNASTPAIPSPPSRPMTLALTPLGQKSIENIQLRFQLLQRDLRDIEKQECSDRGFKPDECRLDAERGALIYTPPPESSTLVSPKANAPGTEAPKPPSLPAQTPKSGEAQKPAILPKK